MRKTGFTLAELLIALAILGVIATFTIPKVLQSQQDSRYKAIAKEAAGAMSAAWQAYLQNNTPTASTHSYDVTPYLNYVAFYTNNLGMDNEYTTTTHFCLNSNPCVLLHNGATLWFDSDSLGGTGTTNLVDFDVDPDGKVTDGTTNGPGHSVEFALYLNGRITDRSGVLPGSINGGGAYANNPSRIPPWFSWN